MAGIAYKEEVLSYGSNSEITLKYTDLPEDHPNLSWCQIFYLRSSVLICKVLHSTLILDQLFFSSPPSSSSKTLKIHLPGLIIPQLSLTCDSQIFSLFTATASGHVFKLTFNQDQPFSDSDNIRDMAGYLLETLRPTCFTLVSISDEDYEVCVGLETGRLCFATLPLSLSNEFIFPIKTQIIDLKTNLFKKIKAFVSSRLVEERVLRVANLKNSRIMTLSNFSVLRIYNSDKIALMREVDLEFGLIDDCKFAVFVNGIEGFVAIGASEGPTWWVTLIRILTNKLEIVTKFSEKGFLVDLAVDSLGVWSAWTDDSQSQIAFKAFRSDCCQVFSFNDSLFDVNVEDCALGCANSAEILKRILAPGRFTKKIVKEAFLQVLGIEFGGFEGLDGLEVEELKTVLNYAKMKNWQDSQIIALACSEEIGHFPAMVVRGLHRIGVLRPVKNEIESCGLYIVKAALYWNPLNRVSHVESETFFRLACNFRQLNRCLLIVHTWRQNFCFKRGVSVRNRICKVAKEPMAENLRHLLCRALPPRVAEWIAESFRIFQSFCTEYREVQGKAVRGYVSRFALALLGNGLVSIVQSLLDYFIDLSLFISLCLTTLKTSVLQTVSQDMLITSLNITEFLWCLANTLSSPFIESSNFDSNSLEQFYFQHPVAPVYIQARSDLLILQNDLFEIENCNLWIANTLHLALQDLLVISSDFKGKNFVLMHFLLQYEQGNCIENWYQQLDSADAYGWYFLAKALIAENKMSDAEKLLTRITTDLMSGEASKNYEKLIDGPWVIEKDAISESSNILSLLNKGISDSLESQHKKLVFLSDFIISSLYSDFNEQSVLNSVELLGEIFAFAEGVTFAQSHPNRKVVKKAVLGLVEKAVTSNKFSKFLQVPLAERTKNTIHEFLFKKSSEEHFSVFDTIQHEKYFDQAKNIFQSFHLRDRHKTVTLSWTLAFYSFAMKNSRFRSAAEATYKIFDEISSNLATDTRISSQEKHFLSGIQIEYLTLTTLAARNISPIKSKCFFLVSKLNFKKKKDEKPRHLQSITLVQEEIFEDCPRKTITITELEQVASSIFAQKQA